MYDHSQHAGEVAGAVAKATPPLAVSGMAVAGLALQDWLLIAIISSV
jgi:hypothetical protein